MNVCDYCLNKDTDTCFGCEPTKFEPVTRIALMRRMDADELAEYLESELGDGVVPADWLAWLTDAIVPTTLEVWNETS